MKSTNTFFGIPIREVMKATGLPWATVYRHAHEQRRISPECAVKYNKALGIPLADMRPDLWGGPVDEQTHECA